MLHSEGCPNSPFQVHPLFEQVLPVGWGHLRPLAGRTAPVSEGELGGIQYPPLTAHPLSSSEIITTSEIISLRLFILNCRLPLQPVLSISPLDQVDVRVSGECLNLLPTAAQIPIVFLARPAGDPPVQDERDVSISRDPLAIIPPGEVQMRPARNATLAGGDARSARRLSGTCRRATRSCVAMCMYSSVQPVCSSPSPSRSWTTAPTSERRIEPIGDGHHPGIIRHTAERFAWRAKIQRRPAPTHRPSRRADRR